MPEIREFRKQDRKKAIAFARTGMHFDKYTQNPLMLWLYGRYFWTLEHSKATRILAAYEGEELLGILMAQFDSEPAMPVSWPSRLFLKMVDGSMDLFFQGGPDLYTQTNRKMYEDFSAHFQEDGEIRFLAVSPEHQNEGIGSLLLNALAGLEPGKRVYLYTDDGCSWEFYERKGFFRSGDESIVMDFGGSKVPLRCFLFTKVL